MVIFVRTLDSMGIPMIDSHLVIDHIAFYRIRRKGVRGIRRRDGIMISRPYLQKSDPNASKTALNEAKRRYESLGYQFHYELFPYGPFMEEKNNGKGHDAYLVIITGEDVPLDKCIEFAKAIPSKGWYRNWGLDKRDNIVIE